MHWRLTLERLNRWKKYCDTLNLQAFVTFKFTSTFKAFIKNTIHYSYFMHKRNICKYSWYNDTTISRCKIMFLEVMDFNVSQLQGLILLF